MPVHIITMQLSRLILIILKERQGNIPLTELLKAIATSMRDVPDNGAILHQLDLLVDDGLIIRTHNGGWNEYQLSSKGYAKLKAWYEPKKFFALMSNDFAKGLSIVATILSIIATYFSIRSHY